MKYPTNRRPSKKPRDTVDKRLIVRDCDGVIFRDQRKSRKSKVTIRIPTHVTAVVVNRPKKKPKGK